jgi:hypothetical protein
MVDLVSPAVMLRMPSTMSKALGTIAKSGCVLHAVGDLHLGKTYRRNFTTACPRNPWNQLNRRMRRYPRPIYRRGGDGASSGCRIL